MKTIIDNKAVKSDISTDIFTPIPKEDMPDTSRLTYSESDEAFVDILDYSDGIIAVDMKYYEQGRWGSIDKAYVRLGVAKRLMRAQDSLPNGYRLKIFDAWRPYEVQRDLFDEYLASVSALPENEGKSEDELIEMAKRFVSFPDRSRRFAYVHSSGGAVDLTLIDRDGCEVDMGCGFDDFTPLASTSALEGEDSLECDNRRVLYNAMIRAGFTNYPAEWWHYDFGDIFWAATMREAVKYPSVYSLDEVVNEDLVKA